MFEGNEFSEKIINDILEKGYSINDQVLNLDQFQELIERFEDRIDQDEFKKAGIGKNILHQIDSEVRGDYIRWIDIHDKESPTNYLYQQIHELIPLFNRYCYLGLKTFESHYAIYPKGAGYQVHRDQFVHAPHRIISFVYYLNDDWKNGDGGELNIYDDDMNLLETVEPLANRIVIFLSKTLHEVLPCNQPRKSITGWILDKPLDLTFL